MPIEIKVNGSYHSFGEFVSGVAALPRIVTLHDINISKVDKKGAAGQLLLQASAKTYRYLDDEEIAAVRKAQASKKQPAKKGK